MLAVFNSKFMPHTKKGIAYTRLFFSPILRQQPQQIFRKLEFRREILEFRKIFLSLDKKNWGFILKHCIFYLIFPKMSGFFTFPRKSLKIDLGIGQEMVSTSQESLVTATFFGHPRYLATWGRDHTLIMVFEGVAAWKLLDCSIFLRNFPEIFWKFEKKLFFPETDFEHVSCPPKKTNFANFGQML